MLLDSLDTLHSNNTQPECGCAVPQEEVESLEGFVRPGCVQLTVSYRFDSGDRLENARSALLANLRLMSGASALPWAQMDAVVTVGDTRFTVSTLLCLTVKALCGVQGRHHAPAVGDRQWHRLGNLSGEYSPGVLSPCRWKEVRS